MQRWWAPPLLVRPGLPFGLLLLGAAVATSALAAAAIRLALAGAGGVWPGLGIAGLQCLLVPTRADAGAHALSYIFGAGLVATVGWTLVALAGQLRGTRRLAAAVAAQRAVQAPRGLRRTTRRLALADRVDLVTAPEPFAFCYGLVRPRICASTGLAAHLGAPEVEAVLRHERYHVYQHDPLKMAVGRALAAALFFLPVVTELMRRYELARELAADRRVVAEMGRTRPLAGALYRLVTHDGWPAHTSPGPAVGLASPGAPLAGVSGGDAADGSVGPGGWSTLDVRIDHLLGDPTPRLPLVSRRAAAVSAAVLLLATTPLLVPTPSSLAAAMLVDAHLIPGLC